MLGWVLSHIPFALAFHFSWRIPDDFACNLEAVASMLYDSVMGDHGHCSLTLDTAHWLTLHCIGTLDTGHWLTLHGHIGHMAIG